MGKVVVGGGFQQINIEVQSVELSEIIYLGSLIRLPLPIFFADDFSLNRTWSLHKKRISAQVGLREIQRFYSIVNCCLFTYDFEMITIELFAFYNDIGNGGVKKF